MKASGVLASNTFSRSTRGDGVGIFPLEDLKVSPLERRLSVEELRVSPRKKTFDTTNLTKPNPEPPKTKEPKEP